MGITLEKFRNEHYEEYRSWFEDEALKYLGHVDQAWLDHILNDKSGEELVAKIEGKMVGVVGVTFPDKEHSYYVITNLSVSPVMQNKGIGSNIVDALMRRYTLHENEYFMSYVDVHNDPAKNFFLNLGWKPGQTADGMIEFTFLKGTSS